jgi:uncharacterized membrane protein YbaN (DUF454 family)
MRLVYLLLGLFFCALGFIGAFLPVVPTTPFLILAAGCFARSSPRLENWLLQHRTFGPNLRAWRDRGAIPLNVKLIALASMGLSFALLLLVGNAGALTLTATAILMAAGLGYIFTRPSR